MASTCYTINVVINFKSIILLIVCKIAVLLKLSFNRCTVVVVVFVGCVDLLYNNNDNNDESNDKAGNSESHSHQALGLSSSWIPGMRHHSECSKHNDWYGQQPAFQEEADAREHQGYDVRAG